LASGRFKLVPAFEELLDVRMFAHDLASALAIIKEMWIGDVAFEFCETFAFAFDEQIDIHKQGVCATRATRRLAQRLYSNLSFLLGSRRFGAAVTAGGFFHAFGGFGKLLFARGKMVVRWSKTDLN